MIPATSKYTVYKMPLIVQLQNDYVQLKSYKRESHAIKIVVSVTLTLATGLKLLSYRKVAECGEAGPVETGLLPE